MRVIGALLGFDALWQVEVLVAAALEATVLVALAALAARTLGARPQLAHAAWTAGLVAALALPLASAVLPQRPLRYTLPAALVHLDNVPDVGPLREALAERLAPDLVRPGAEPGAGDAMAGAVDAAGPGPLAWTLLAWLSGAALAGVRLACAAWRVRGLVRRSAPVAGEDLRALERLAVRVGGRRPRILESTEIDVPFTVGALHATIVLPRRRDWSAETRDLVLAHELAHVRRRDGIHHLLGAIAAALYWFHPLVRVAARRQREEAERASDALVLRTGVRAASYAHGILEVVRGARRLDPAPVAMPFAQPARLEARLRTILGPRPRAPRAAGVALAFALLAATAAGAALVRPAAAPGNGAKPCVENAPVEGASFFAIKCQSISRWRTP